MLLLSSIEIENFRGIRQGKVEGLTEVNVLIGRNNCGKTTLAEALHKTLVGGIRYDLLGRQISEYWLSVRNENSGTRRQFPNATGKLRYRGRLPNTTALGRP